MSNNLFNPHADLHEKQKIAFFTPATEILYGGAAGGGKALSIDTPIPTPDGWKTMEQLQSGDQVFDENGEVCNVLGATEIMYGRPCYLVTFSDGSTLIADAKHQWFTMDNREREQARRLTAEFRENRRGTRVKRGTGKRNDLSKINAGRVHKYIEPPTGSIRTTEQIAESVFVRGRTNHSVQVAKPLQLPEQGLPIDPYILGLWLGDGNSGCGGFTTGDEEIVKAILGAGYEVTKYAGKYRYGIVGLKVQLSKLEVLNNKHIPTAYLRASESQRISLLQGLMDTDGTCLPLGSCEFYNCNKILIDQVCELINSLGIKAVVREGRATLNGKDCGPKYRVKFTTPMPVFRLKRKSERQAKETRPTCSHRMIVSAERINSVPVKCIEVDSLSHLYLAGKAMIPTHNSHLMRYVALWCAVFCAGIQIYIFRRTYPDLIKNHMEGPTSFPVLLAPLIGLKLAKIDYGKGVIKFANGSRIFLCHCQYEKDVTNYQGAEIHLLLIDELTLFTDKIYRFLRGRCRLGAWRPPKQLIHCFPRILCGSNPGGIGHNFVKQMFVTSAPALKMWKTAKKDGGMLRQFIPAKLDDNPTMEQNDPEYRDRLYGLGAKHLVDAMLDGNWDIVAGGALDDVWNADRQMITPFDIPADWYVDRSFDWGSTKPFSVGWWAKANGEDVQLKDGTWRWFPAGSIIRIREWYGWNGEANTGCKMLASDIAKGIKEREQEWGLKVNPGPADSAIFSTENGNCIADDMADEGVYWTKADKSPGSRIQGLEKVRQMLKASTAKYPEEPGLYAFNTCSHFRRTMPVLPRDEKKMDDVDTNAEEHLYDDVRYRVTMPAMATETQEV